MSAQLLEVEKSEIHKIGHYPTLAISIGRSGQDIFKMQSGIRHVVTTTRNFQNSLLPCRKTTCHEKAKNSL